MRERSSLESLYKVAFKEALKATCRQRHGAVVVDSGGRILAKAFNDPKRHAEMRAIKRVSRGARSSITAIIVVRARRSQRYGMSRPCFWCQKAIRDAKIRVVYYSTNDGSLSCETYGD